ncbi:MAG: protein kinase domain-containing protein, partial [Thermoleophilia bacterium]
MPDIPEIFDNRYEIVKRLGSGGMADVYLARDTHLGREVAIKILYKRYARDEEFVARFRREAQAAAGLNHPHIVSIYDRGEADGSYYIAMEYLEGKSLKDLIAQKGSLPPDKAIFVAEQILQALQFAHEHNVIHRDIKPHNIVISGRGEVKVTDFGIARAGTSAKMTETGSILGTAQYLSPEQAKGKAVEQGSDLYSLGVVLYEMLTGRVPFEGENPVAIALKHLSDVPVPPQALKPGIPDNLNTVVMKALAKDPR